MKIALALQGGGAHGAYTWGVLERLLEEPALDIRALSGASAGAVNAVALADGWQRGGRQGARERLAAVWQALGAQHLSEVWPARVPEGFAGMHQAALKQMLLWTRWFSPEQFNPLDIHPLREVLAAEIDFDAVRASAGPALYLAATDVRARRARIFTRPECTLDVLLASTCLPQIHHGVVIDDRLYWDGGLTANPPLWPLIVRPEGPHVVLVRLTGAAKADGLDSAEAIRAEMTELSFDAPLSAELDSIAIARDLALRHRFSFGTVERRLRSLELDVIHPPMWLAESDPITRADPEPRFIETLRRAGQRAAEDWLRQSHGRRLRLRMR